MGQTHRLRPHPVVGCLWGDLLYTDWLPWPARVRCRRVVMQCVGARHPPALYGRGAQGGGLVWHVLVVRGRSLASLVLAGLSLLTGVYRMQGRKMYRWRWRIMGLATVMMLLPMAAWACAVCFEGDDALARGLNMSILFLMSMPFAIFGSIFGAVYLMDKRGQRHGNNG